MGDETALLTVISPDENRMSLRFDKPVPTKLKQDAIIEAVLEVRFSSDVIPEVMFGRLFDHPEWRGFGQRKLPAYEIPEPFRQVDPNLRFAPVFELNDPERNSSVRMGPRVLSIHQRAPYVGWAVFERRLQDGVKALFEKGGKLTVTRLGLRYINALRRDAHRISSVADLDLMLTVAGQQIPGNVNLNFANEVEQQTVCMLRIATPELLEGVLPAEASVVIDIDVFTKDPFKTTDIEAVNNWIAFAHTQEKRHFFGLLDEKTIDDLKA